MGDPMATDIYECFMAGVGELGALLAHTYTYEDNIMMRDATL